MKPKRILSDGVLHILIDSESLLQSYTNNPKSLNFLRYRREKYFDMKRTPARTGVPEIDSIPAFENVIGMPANSGSIKYTKGHASFQIQVTSNLADIEKRHMMIFNEPTVTDENWRRIWNIFVHARLGHNIDSNIYITSDDAILKNRDHFVNQPVDRSVNILSIDEGKEVMDIFAKKLGYCLITPGSENNFVSYYAIAFRSCLPHYHHPRVEEMMDEKGAPRKDIPPLKTLSNRFIYVLKCMDKMGIGYYYGIDYFTNFDIHFYFNYFMMLMTGIFDSLALDTRKRYKISFKGDNIPSKTSLSKKTGKVFLKEVENCNHDLYSHIVANGELIGLIYHFRESIIHREFQVPIILHADTRIDDGLMRVEPDVAAYLSQLGDKKSKYDRYSEWGYIENEYGRTISLYTFSKRALLYLINFVDGYLEKSGFGDSVMEDPDDELNRSILELREADMCCRHPRNVL